MRDGSGVWSQQAYIKASNTGAIDAFGFTVAVSGDTVVVGALGEDSNAMGVNGNEANNSAFASGAAYVFVRDGMTWSQQAYLKASNTGGSDFFGASVAISGNTLVVGAFLEDSNATGVGGNQANNSVTQSGAVYVFVRDSGGVWSQQAYLKASNTDAFDEFGGSVAVLGDTVVVGAANEASNATGVGGNQADNSAIFSGAVYVFVRDFGGVWSQRAYLKSSNTDERDRFGWSVAVSGNTVVVGAWGEDSNTTGVNGNQTNNSVIRSGAAYVFVITPIVCGDGVVESTEQCDDSGESAACDVDCTAAECGDGNVNVSAGEQCDDGDGIDNNDCTNSCLAPTCGDGITWNQGTGVEQCDGGARCAACCLDQDEDGVCDDVDGCPNDPNKVGPGQCGCGVSDVDTDGDTVSDCIDTCPGVDDLAFGDCSTAIPTVSEWGLIILSLLLLVGGKAYFGRSRTGSV